MSSTDEETSSDAKISLMAVGDIMLGRKVGVCLEKESPTWLFEKVQKTLERADFLIGNLECPILNDGFDENSSAVIPLFCKSKYILPVLKSIKFSLLNLANNHVLDFGQPGLFHTMSCLSENGMNFVGAGKDLLEAKKGSVHNIKGTTFSFLSYCPSYNATDKSGGTAPFNLKNILSGVNSEKLKSDIVVVSIHCGVEYSDYPTLEFISQAHQIIDSGADLIICHHPHVLQGIEKYKGGIIAYSLGNFVFDSPDPEIRNLHYSNCLLLKKYGIIFEKNDNRINESCILEVVILNKKISEINTYPVVIKSELKPYLVFDIEKDSIDQRLERISRDIGNLNLPQYKVLSDIDHKIASDYFKTMGLKYIAKKVVNAKPREIWHALKIVFRGIGRLFTDKSKYV